MSGDAQRLGNLTKATGANRAEIAYSNYWRENGVRLKRRYYPGVTRQQWGAGSDYSGRARPKRPNTAPPYNPAEHARTVLAGGRKLHAKQAAS